MTVTRRGIQAGGPPRNALLQNQRQTRAVRLSLDGARPVRHILSMSDDSKNVKPVSSGVLAGMLGVDIKTIHAYVARGVLPATRLPGGARQRGQLRFDLAAVAARLRSRGDEVPAALERRVSGAPEAAGEGGA